MGNTVTILTSCCYGCLDGPNGCVGCCENAPHDEPFSHPQFVYAPVPQDNQSSSNTSCNCPPPTPALPQISLVINNNCNNNNNNTREAQDQNQTPYYPPVVTVYPNEKVVPNY